MNKSNFRIVTLFLLTILVQSCSNFNFKEKPTVYAVDMVCNMRVNVSEAFLYKYKGKNYFFDSYDCKQAFKMNPDKFINNMLSSKFYIFNLIISSDKREYGQF